MNSLKIGISGVRGVVGETFTPELATQFAQAFGTYLDGGKVLVCRDARASGPMVLSAVSAGLLSTGVEVLDCGICPTPSLQYAVRKLRADGGISITAGHNPEPWNALKFVRSDGLYLNATQADELLDIFHQAEFLKAGWTDIRSSIHSFDAIEAHLERLSSAFDIHAIRSRRFVVAVDCCNSSCALLSPRWLQMLGCDVLSINDDVTAPFPHAPEPGSQTLAQLRALVRAGKADIGFAHDADGERLGIVTADGRALSEETTLAIAAEIQLRRKVGPVVTNISTTSAIDDIAALHGATVKRTAVGQINVSEAMIAAGAVIGGEGSGGVIIPAVQWSHDSVAAIGLILEHMAISTEPISELVGALPHYVMLKHNITVDPDRIHMLLQRFHEELIDEAIEFDELDGIKVNLAGGWLHARISNTESIIRLIAEAKDEGTARELLEWGRDRFASTSVPQKNRSKP